MIRPNESWVAKWNGVSGKFQPGLYAVGVNEHLEPDVYETEKVEKAPKKKANINNIEDEDDGEYSVGSDW